MLPYHETIKQILVSLDVSILEAKAELPEHLRWEHDRIQRSRQVVDAWREVQEQYQTRNQEPEHAVARALDALCLACVHLNGAQANVKPELRKFFQKLCSGGAELPREFCYIHVAISLQKIKHLVNALLNNRPTQPISHSTWFHLF